MSELNSHTEQNETENPNVIDAEVHTTTASVSSPIKKEKKNHPVLVVLLSAVLGTSGGALGAYLVTSNNASSKQVIVYQDTNGATTSNTANTANSGLSIKEIAAKASPSVVEINIEGQTTGYGFFGGTYTTQAAGSGVIISKDGYIITNNHVVEGATSITVKTSDGTEYAATLVGTDSKSDIGVIKVEADNLTPATIGDSSTISVGDTAVVIGNPLGTLGGTVTNGIISATDREISINNETMNLIQTNAAINSGNSGGGMFDANGNLIGVVNAKDSGTTSSGTTIEGLGFAIPINDAMNVAKQLIESGQVTDRPTIGVTLQTITKDYGNYKAGLYITDVSKGSGAEATGLQPGDQIVGADGTEISSYTELSKILRNKHVGDILTLTIVRDGEQMDVDVTLTGALTEIAKG